MRSDRNRQGEALDDLDLLPDDQADGSAGMLLQTSTDGTYPVTAASVYSCVPLLVDADDTEGASPGFSVDASTHIYALNIGSQIPPGGTKVIASGVGGRWVFDYSTPP